MNVIAKKYYFRNKDTNADSMCFKVVCGVADEHLELEKAIKDDENIVFCGVEYMFDINLENMSSPIVLKNETYKTEKEQENEKN